MKDKFVQIGRVCVVNFGRNINKLCTIVDIVDANRVLVDGPESVTGVPRHVMSLRRLVLTKFTVHIPRGARQKTLRKAVADAGLVEKWEKTSWARKIQRRQRRAAMTDFDRFKLMAARIHVHGAIRRELAHVVSAERRQKLAAAAEAKKKKQQKKPAAAAAAKKTKKQPAAKAK